MKTLILDIETAPIMGFVWQIWQQNLGLEQIKTDWYILSFSAKWLGENGIVYEDQEAAVDIEDDTPLLRRIATMLDEADIVVAHNGRKFDIPKINTRFLLKGIPIPSPYKIVDTLDIAKKNFAFTSNKLEFLSGVLAKKKKLKHTKFPGFTLWKECLLRNPAAWAEMRKYNIRDTVSLEEVYLKLRPWNKIAPNAGVFAEGDKHACSKCGSTHVQARGYAFTQVGKYQRYQCKKCGGWSRGRQILNTKETRDVLLTNCL